MNEIAAYVNLHQAVFESKNMTVAWRERTLQRPKYIPDLDLVIAAPDGRLAAFCVCWLHKDLNGNISGQIEPLGVHSDFEIRVRAGNSSGRLEDIKKKGATQIYVQTDNYRTRHSSYMNRLAFRCFTIYSCIVKTMSDDPSYASGQRPLGT